MTHGDDIITLDEPQQLNSFLRVNSALDSALGREPEEFEFMQPEKQGAWADAYLKAREVVAAGDGKKFEALAKEANHAFQCSLNPQEVVAWETILPEYRLKWVFLIRQTVNILEWASDLGSIQPYEEDLVNLFREQLAALQPQTESTP